jgi:hypothetical protein
VHNGERRDDAASPHWQTRRARLVVILVVALLSLLVAGCGDGSASPGVASVGSTMTTTTASSPALGNSGVSTAGALAYARCMRSKGLSDFPDPNAQGGFDDLPSNISFNSSRFIAANKLCQSLNGGGHQLSLAGEEQIEARGLKCAQCMRSHGEPNYPDPTFKLSGGGITEQQGSSSRALNARSPRFQAAQRACQQVRAASGS